MRIGYKICLKTSNDDFMMNVSIMFVFKMIEKIFLAMIETIFLFDKIRTTVFSLLSSLLPPLSLPSFPSHTSQILLLNISISHSLLPYFLPHTLHLRHTPSPSYLFSLLTTPLTPSLTFLLSLPLTLPSFLTSLSLTL